MDIDTTSAAEEPAVAPSRRVRPAQLRAARAYLGLSGKAFCEEARIGTATLNRYEASDGDAPAGSHAVAVAIGGALERLGVRCVDVGGENGILVDSAAAIDHEPGGDNPKTSAKSIASGAVIAAPNTAGATAYLDHRLTEVAGDMALRAQAAAFDAANVVSSRPIPAAYLERKEMVGAASANRMTVPLQTGKADDALCQRVLERAMFLSRKAAKEHDFEITSVVSSLRSSLMDLAGRKGCDVDDLELKANLALDVDATIDDLRASSERRRKETSDLAR